MDSGHWQSPISHLPVLNLKVFAAMEEQLGRKPRN